MKQHQYIIILLILLGRCAASFSVFPLAELNGAFLYVHASPYFSQGLAAISPWLFLSQIYGTTLKNLVLTT